MKAFTTLALGSCLLLSSNLLANERPSNDEIINSFSNKSFSRDNLDRFCPDRFSIKNESQLFPIELTSQDISNEFYQSFFGIRQLQCISKIDRAIFDNLLTISLNSDDATTRRSVFNYFGRTAFAKNSNISDDYKRDVVIAALNLLETETDENVIYGAVHAIGVQAQSISFNSELYEKFIQRSSSVTPDSSVPHVLSLFRTMELANNRILENSKAALDQEDMINAYYILRQHEDDNFIAAGIRGLKNFGVQDEDIIRYVVRSSYDTESDFVFYVALKHFRNEIVANKDLHDFLFGDYLDEYGWDLHLLIMDIINELPELTEDQLGILKNYSESGLYEEAREVAESIYNKHTRSKIGLLLQYFRK